MKPISEIIQNFESGFNPNSIKVNYRNDDFEVYPWIKPFVFSAIQQGDKVSTGNKSLLFQFKSIFSGISLLLQKQKSIFFTNSLEKRQVDNVVYDKLFHEFSKKKVLNPSFSVEVKLPSSHYYRKHYKDKAVASRAIFFACELIYQKLFLRNIKITGIERLEELSNEYNLNIDFLYPIKKNIAQYVVMTRFIRMKKNLKNVFLSVSYTNFGIIRACKEMNINTIEIQHGVINTEHYGYYYCYEPNLNQFPDFLLTFGESDVKFVNSGNLSKFIKGFAIGSFMIDYYSNKANKLKSSKIESVAISLQDCETGVESVKTFVELAEYFPLVTFFLKRRRLELEFYNSEFSFPENVVFEENLNIYELIVKCDIHLTAYSSCAIEAPSLGTANLLFNLNNKSREYYSSKLEEKHNNFYCDTFSDLKNAIESYKPIKSDYLQSQNKKNIKNNYKKNIDSFLEHLT